MPLLLHRFQEAAEAESTAEADWVSDRATIDFSIGLIIPSTELCKSRCPRLCIAQIFCTDVTICIHLELLMLLLKKQRSE